MATRLATFSPCSSSVRTTREASKEITNAISCLLILLPGEKEVGHTQPSCLGKRLHPLVRNPQIQIANVKCIHYDSRPGGMA